ASTPRLSPDGKRVALRGPDGKLRIVGLDTGEITATDFEWRGDGHVAFTPDGKRLVVSDYVEPRRLGAMAPAAGAKDEPASHLHLIDAATGKTLGLVNHTSFETGIGRLRVVGKGALAGFRDAAIRLVDLDTGKIVRDVWQP